MLVLVKYEDGTVRSVESMDVKEVSSPVRGIIVYIADSADCIFVKANDPDKECLEIHNVFISNHLNLTNYGVAEPEEYDAAKEVEETPKVSAKDYFLKRGLYYVVLATFMYLAFSGKFVEIIDAVADYMYKWMYPIFGDYSCWVLLGAVCIFVIVVGYVIYKVNEKKLETNNMEKK